jgi:two-component system, NarL family, response regulator NreC
MAFRILLADDHLIVRQGIRALLERSGMEIVGEAGDGQEAVRLAEKHKPDVAVLDLVMPTLNGLEAGRLILQKSPVTKVILLTMQTEDHQVATALRAGIKAYLLKTQAAEDLVEAIKQVMRGQMFLSSAVSRVVVDGYLSGAQAPVDPLAPRERQVLQLVAEGKTSKEIAALLNVSVKTAESYRANIMEKLDIHETAGLVRYAIRRGLIVP